MTALNQGISLGPFGFGLGLLIFVLATVVAFFIAWLMDRRQARKLESSLFGLLLTGLLVARLVFVLRYLDRFPGLLAMLDIRDHGFDPLGGLAGSGLYLAWLARKRGRESLALLVPLAGGLALWLVLAAAAILTHSTPAGLPSAELNALRGPPVNPAAWMQGDPRPTVINVWATWCPPCRREMPMFEAAAREHKDIRFIFLNQGEDPARVSAWLTASELDLDYVLLDRDGDYSRALQVRVLPTTLFFDARGQLQAQHVGELSRASLQQRLERID